MLWEQHCRMFVSSEGPRRLIVRYCPAGKGSAALSGVTEHSTRCWAPVAWLFPATGLRGHIVLTWQVALVEGWHQCSMPLHALKEG